MSTDDKNRDAVVASATRIGALTAAADINFLCDQLGLPRTGPHRPSIESFREQVWQVAVETALDEMSASQQ